LKDDFSIPGEEFEDAGFIRCHLFRLDWETNVTTSAPEIRHFKIPQPHSFTFQILNEEFAELILILHETDAFKTNFFLNWAQIATVVSLKGKTDVHGS